MNTEEKNRYRMEWDTLKADVEILKHATRELARDVAELKHIEYSEMCRRLGLDRLS